MLLLSIIKDHVTPEACPHIALEMLGIFWTKSSQCPGYLEPPCIFQIDV